MPPSSCFSSCFPTREKWTLEPTRIKGNAKILLMNKSWCLVISSETTVMNYESWHHWNLMTRFVWRGFQQLVHSVAAGGFSLETTCSKHMSFSLTSWLQKATLWSMELEKMIKEMERPMSLGWDEPLWCLTQCLLDTTRESVDCMESWDYYSNHGINSLPSCCCSNIQETYEKKKILFQLFKE